MTFKKEHHPMNRRLIKLLRPILLPIIQEAMAERDAAQRKVLADTISGQMGRGIAGRSFTTGTGVDVSY